MTWGFEKVKGHCLQQRTGSLFCKSWLLLCVLFFSIVESSAQAPGLKVRLNLPHVLYEGDRLEVSAAITNTTDTECTGQLTLQLFDANGHTSVDGWFQNVFPVQYFTVAPGKTEVFPFPIEVPYLFHSAVQWQAFAKSGKLMAADSGVLAIRTTKSLVTIQIPVRLQNGAQNNTIEPLLNQNAVHEPFVLTTELFSNALWPIVSALPNVAQAPVNTAADAVAALAASVLAQQILHHTPELQDAAIHWRNGDSSTNMMLNPVAFQTVQETTPWAMRSKNEAGLNNQRSSFFNAKQLQKEILKNWQQLQRYQQNSGGFSWYRNGAEDAYITARVLCTIGVLKNLNAFAPVPLPIDSVVKAALTYLDDVAVNVVTKKGTHDVAQLTPTQVYILYARSFFPPISVSPQATAAYKLSQQKASKQWRSFNMSQKMMLALALYRNGDRKTAAAILQSFKKNLQSATSNDISNPVPENTEFISFALSAIQEMESDTAATGSMQERLLNSLQNVDEQPTYLTTQTILALLQNHLPQSPMPDVAVRLGNHVFITTADSNVRYGYLKKIVTPPALQPELGSIQIRSAAHKTPSFLAGSVTYSYFTDSSIRKMPPTVQLRKQLYHQKHNKQTLVTENTTLHLGDTVDIVVTIVATQPVDYITVKDICRGPFAPIHEGRQDSREILQDSEAVSFYISHLKKGSRTYQYRAVLTHAGQLTVGSAKAISSFSQITTSHNRETRIRIEE